jgi:hypothetical protein
LKTINLTKEYKLKWQLKNMPHYQITECSNIINMQTGKLLKRTINGGYSVGYWIGKKFISLSKLNEHCEKIKETKTPF